MGLQCETDGDIDDLGGSEMRRFALVVMALVGVVGMSTGAFAASVTYVLDTPGVV